MGGCVYPLATQFLACCKHASKTGRIEVSGKVKEAAINVQAFTSLPLYLIVLNICSALTWVILFNHHRFSALCR